MKRFFYSVLSICNCIFLLAGCGTTAASGGTEASGSAGTATAAAAAPASAGFEAKETGIYLMAPVQSPLKLNLYFNGSDVPYVSLEEWKDLFVMLMSANAGEDEQGFVLSYETDGDKAVLKRDFGDGIVYPMEFDFAADTIHLMDYNVFFSMDKDSPLIPLMDMDEGFVRTAENGNEIAGDEITFDLSSYDIDMIRQGDQYFVPFQTVTDIFSAQQPYTISYNGEAIFISSGEMFYDDDNQLTAFGEIYYSAPEKERSEALGKYTCNELCFLLDHFYGLKENHGITSFDRLFDNNGFREHLAGTDPTVSDALLYRTIHYILNDQHSKYLACSPLSGGEYTAKLTKQFGQGPCREETLRTLAELSAARSQYYPDGIPAYEEIGNTAYITFDNFTKPTRNYKESPATAEDRDTIGIISYSIGQILREDSPVQNVVLDLSQNVGGAAPAAAYVLSAFLKDANLSVRDTMTHAMATYTYMADTNLDGTFDEADTLAGKGLHLFCLTSKASFSCANLVPCVFKQSGNVALIGHQTGGGACTITPMASADGSLFRTSSNMQLSFMRNGSFYDVDQGVEPDYFIHDLSFLYDRQGLTAYLNGLR